MSLKIEKNLFTKILLFTFLFICIFFPADYYSLKKISFALLIVYNLKNILFKIGYGQYMVVFCISIIFPVGTIIQSLILGSDLSVAILSGYAGVFFLLYIIVAEKKIDYERVLMFLLKILSIVIVTIVILDMLHFFDVNADSGFKTFVYEHDIALMGKSSMYAAYYKVFFKTSPLLLILVNHSLDNKQWIFALLGILGLIFSGTRANIFVLCAFLAVRIFFTEVRTDLQKLIKLLLITAFCTGLVFKFQSIFTLFESMMNTAGSVGSDQVRAGQIIGFSEMIKDPLRVLFGAGYGNELIKDYGRGITVTTFEFAYLAMFATVGIYWFIFFMCFLFYPLTKKIDRNLKFAYLGYLAIAFTNPLLYSSTAFVLYLYIYLCVRKVREYKTSVCNSTQGVYQGNKCFLCGKEGIGYN